MDVEIVESEPLRIVEPETLPALVGETDMLYLALRVEQARSAGLAAQIAQQASMDAQARLDAEKIRIRTAYRLGDDDRIDLTTGQITRKN